MKYSTPKFTGIIGNLLEHYDNALYGLLVPFISPLFFSENDPITSLILAYCLLPIGLLTRPLGSLVFGWIGDHWGRKQALFYSLLGMAICTIGIGCLPAYKDIGIWAPIFLGLAKMCQNFFAAGEASGGAIFVLEHTTPTRRGFASSFYDASSIAGILTASAFVTYLAGIDKVETYWRLLFFLGGITGFFGIILRWKSEEAAEFVTHQNSVETSDWFSVLKANKSILFTLSLAVGFSYTTYSLAFTLMNGLVPIVTNLSKLEVMQVNTALLIVDMLLLPFFGYLTNHFGKEKVMLGGVLCSIFGAIPLFWLLDQASLAQVVFVRFFIILFGVAFAAPYYAWAMEKISPCHRYLILSVASAIGSQLIGAPASAVCLWLYQATGLVIAPGVYLAILGIAVLLSCGLLKKRIINLMPVKIFLIKT